jgi:ABC-type lipoprotein release transport system permease subunit
MSGLIRRGLTYYWRTHLAVVFGVATAVAVLAGALLVGDSVRGSLRGLVVGRLGNTDYLVASAGFFREQLATDLQNRPEAAGTLSSVIPLVVANAVVSVQETGRKVGHVRVYGVDDRFWRFHAVGEVTGPASRDAFVSPALAAQIGAVADSVLLVRVQRPTDIPLESLHGRRDEVGRTLRLTLRRILPANLLGDFALDAQQGDVRAVFVPLSRLQQDLSVEGRVNTLLASATDPGADATSLLEQAIRGSAQLEDVGLNTKALTSGTPVLSIGADAGLIDAPRAASITKALEGSGFRAEPMFTYLANTMRVGDREVPYSLVTATNDPNVTNPPSPAASARQAVDEIVLTDWAAKDLNAKAGDALTMDYYLYEDGQIVTRTTTFRVAKVVPLSAGDRDMAPTFPGISDSPTLESWDPPFPVDLRRVRPQDERFWEQYRTTPKAFVSLATGQRLWRSRYGELTSIRVRGAENVATDRLDEEFLPRLREVIDPVALGLTVSNIRAQSLQASRGATDFGEYFVYFSFFLVVSALVLAALFFKLGVEQRVREVGLLRAVGFGPVRVRRLFLGEGLLLAAAGGLLGVLGALAYASVIMYGLRTWWVDAVGTTSLTLHVTPVSLVAGAVGGMVAAVACIWWTLRSLGRMSERSLLAGDLTPAADLPSGGTTRRRRGPVATVALAVTGVALLAAGGGGWIAPEGAFFGAGSALLVASLAFFSLRLRRQGPSALDGTGWQPVSRLGFRYARYRPGRSVLSMAVIASATFILISVDAFRRAETPDDAGVHSGIGGYGLFLETLLPVVGDVNSRTGRDAMNLFDLDPAITFEPFRLLPGDDASCLNLYEPRNPRILAPTDAFLAKGRFAFQSARTSTEAERTNPWLLLTRDETDGSIPVIGDANSMTYVLHKAVGEDIVIRRGGKDIRLRLVAALRDSLFQGELLMSQSNFMKLFPDQQGYRVMLVEAPAAQASALAAQLEEAMADLGADATTTTERLAQFHRVENTYLSTFQALGGLGLVLGTIGLATVLLRNVLERRRELALLGAVGFRTGHVLTMVVAENVLLLGCGLLAGAICAGLAIAPAIAERGGRLPLTSSGALLLSAVFITGLISSIVAMSAATRAPLLSSLRSE